MQQRTRIFWGILVMILLGTSVCSPALAESRLSSDDLLEQQLAAVERVLAQAPEGVRSVVYLGVAQNAQSPAFHADVLRVQQRLQALDPKLQSIILSNESRSASRQYPVATLNTVRQTLARMAAWASKYPLTLVLLVAPHGKVTALSSQAASDLYAPLQSRHLRVWLDALGDTPMVLMLSACRSGSSIPKLAASHRIVLAAAPADRSPSACDEPSDNTHFIDDMFGAGFDPADTWQRNFDRGGSAPSAGSKSSISETLAARSISEFLRP